ncbi:2,3-bisphosphoglycerate-independent phosphoglycerate mutase [Candidatus Micrarchaeota archaeon]|nr:2,3-bisphosphoglycerate-independent phosphoglycerate mutase [Candidatus Micrarchaeota archaeon]
MKTLLIILDGLGDRPIKELNGKTPLEAAEKPNLNKLAEKGICGMMNSVDFGVRPGSDTSHLSIFGYDPAIYYTGRGPIEAAGAGIELKPGDVALRANLGTVDEKLTILDRRAGRIDSVKPFEEDLNNIKLAGVQVIFRAGVEHRGAVVLRGRNLSSSVSDPDPHEVGLKVKKIIPLEKTKAAENTAKLLEEYCSKAHLMLKNHTVNKERQNKGLLPANYLLVRGAGIVPNIPSFKERYGLNAACIAGGGLYKGIGRLLSMSILTVEGATGGANTNLTAKFNAVKKALEQCDFVFLHIKGTDSLSEDGDFIGKKHFIERVDSATPIISSLNDLLIVVTGDHSTPSYLKQHSADPVPILFCGGGVRTDDVQEFGERACAKGGLGRIKGSQLMPEIINLLGKSKLYGA